MKRLLLVAVVPALLAACTSLLGDFSLSGTGSGDDGGTGRGDAEAGATADGGTDGPPGACPLPSRVCAGVCSDLSSSPNCGACGHDCEGASCTAGVCGAKLLLSNEFSVQHLTIDDQNVYWTQSGTSGSAKQLALAGAGASTPLFLATALDSPSEIAADGLGLVFFLTSNSASLTWNLYKARRGGANTGAAVFGLQQGTAHGIGVDPTHVFYSVQPTLGPGYVINSFPTSGGAVMPLASSAAFGRVLSLALGTTEVLFQDQVAGRVYSVPKVGGGLLTTLSSYWNNLSPQLVAAGGSAFWSNFVGASGGNLVKAPLGPVGSDLLINPLIPNLRDLTTDGTALFYVDGSGGNVGSLAFSGTALPFVAQGRIGQPVLVAVNAKYVVWYESGTGSIYRLAR